MSMKLLRRPLALAALAGGLAAAPVTAHEEHQHHAMHGQAKAAPVAAQGVRIVLADTPLLDQDGRALRLKGDAVGDRIVVVDFIYTSCTTVCPVVSALMAQLQGRLGARVGQDVALLTLTVDPLRDTPARLKEYGRRFDAGPGWRWLTGPKPQVDEALKAFGAYTPNFENHPSLVLVGDGKSGKWLRFYGFPGPDQLVTAVAELTAARGRSGAVQ